METLAWTAERLGTTPEQGRELARRYVETGYPRLPQRYRSGACAADPLAAHACRLTGSRPRSRAARWAPASSPSRSSRA